MNARQNRRGSALVRETAHQTMITTATTTAKICPTEVAVQRRRRRRSSRDENRRRHSSRLLLLVVVAAASAAVLLAATTTTAAADAVVGAFPVLPRVVAAFAGGCVRSCPRRCLNSRALSLLHRTTTTSTDNNGAGKPTSRTTAIAMITTGTERLPPLQLPPSPTRQQQRRRTATTKLYAEKKNKKGQIDESLRTKLVSETIAPWRSLRLFLYFALGSGAFVSGLITLSSVVAGLSSSSSGGGVRGGIGDDVVDLNASVRMYMYLPAQSYRSSVLSRHFARSLAHSFVLPKRPLLILLLYRT